MKNEPDLSLLTVAMEDIAAKLSSSVENATVPDALLCISTSIDRVADALFAIAEAVAKK